jgi:cell division protein ZapA
MSRTVEVRVAGQSFRVVSSAPESEVRRLAEIVNAKLAEIVPKGRAAPPNALLLAAIALAHEVEEERGKRMSVEQRARELLRRVVARIDELLEADPAGREDEALPGAEKAHAPPGATEEDDPPGAEVGHADATEEDDPPSATEEDGHAGAAEDEGDAGAAAGDGRLGAPRERRRAKAEKDERLEGDAAVAHGGDARGARGDRGSFT